MFANEYNHALAQAMVDTIREPLLVLDEDLRVVAASRSFYLTFQTTRQATEGQVLCAVGQRQPDVASLKDQLHLIVVEDSVLDGYEMEWDLPKLGRRVMLLNARRIHSNQGARYALLLAFEDITERRRAERERDFLMREKDLLLQEMQHRVANSLQLIASILLLKARSVPSEETRLHLRDAHDRVLAVAAVQRHLRASTEIELIDMRPYLTHLCASLSDSLIGEDRTVCIQTDIADIGVPASDAVSIGLIVTELVINALKHAFPSPIAEGVIAVTLFGRNSNWRLTVRDNGSGRDRVSVPAKIGLGTSIVSALVEQLGAELQLQSTTEGTSVSIASRARNAKMRATNLFERPLGARRSSIAQIIARAPGSAVGRG